MEQFSKNRKRMNTLFKINLFIAIFIIISTIAFGAYIFFNPEIIGDFFGKIFNGFINAKN